MGADPVEDDVQTANAPETGGWRFDNSVTQSFEDMLQRSIPQYDVMRKAVTDAAVWFADAARERSVGDVPPLIVDLGTSRGSALAPIVERLGGSAAYTAYEVSEPMIEVAKERFADERTLAVVKHDLRDGYPHNLRRSSATLSVLTLQFVPIECRQRILQGVHDNLSVGGAFIWVEKVLGATAALDALEVDLYYGLKRNNGYTQEAIDRKRLSLEGVLVPLTAAFNEDLLRQAGFRQIDVVWRWMNFCAWVAIRD